MEAVMEQLVRNPTERVAPLKTALLEPGRKVKLQFSTAEREFFEKEAGFTDEELEIFRLRSRGFTVLQISFRMTELYGKDIPSGQYTVGKVEARIRSIKKKILHIL